jgi:CHASE2 domain-containing sensor protein
VETLLHVLVALPVPVLLFLAARRMRTPAGRGLIFGTAAIVFPVLFFTCYAVFWWPAR